jgi:hypothetical protein
MCREQMLYIARYNRRNKRDVSKNNKVTGIRVKSGSFFDEDRNKLRGPV